MELFRQEYLLKLGPNRGQEIYEKLKARELDEKENKNKHTLTKKIVQEALNRYPNLLGPLDASYVLNNLCEDDQVSFFAKIGTSNQHLLLQNWMYMSDKVLRSISMSMGEAITNLDLSGSYIDGGQFEILIARIPRLKVLNVSKCPKVDGRCMSLLSKYGGSSVLELYASEAPLFTHEPLQWIAGDLGIQSKKLYKLMILDLGNSPVEDRGLIAIGNGISRIKYLNLCNCHDITDASIISISNNHLNLEVLNLSQCMKLTNKSIIALARCTQLVSLNLSRCYKIHDKGIIPLSKSCKKIQALNLAGLVKLSELSLFSLVTNCPGILMLNITGCELITISGLNELIKGYKYVESAKSYFGFKPIDHHVDKKLDDQLMFREQIAAQAIQERFRSNLTRRETAALVLDTRRDEAARRITAYMRRFRHRMVFYHVWEDRKLHIGSVTIQRIWRGFQGRTKAKTRRSDRAMKLLLSKHITSIQKMFRGHQSRKNNSFVANAVLNMYSSRRREAETAIAVRVQSGARRYLAQGQMVVYRELRTRRECVERNAAIVIQSAVRVFVSKRRAHHLVVRIQRESDVRERSALRIQSFYRACKGRASATQTAFEIRLRRQIREKNAIYIQRVFRGFRGRQKVMKRQIYIASLNHAATTIQRVFRGSLVMHWRDMRMNIIAAFILDRQVLEWKDRVRGARIRYHNFVEEIRKDSASDEEEEEEDSPWIKYFDTNRNCDYWFNGFTQEVTYEEPRSEVHHEKQLIQHRVRIYWPMQRQWYEGTITKFHRKKCRHRIDYDDGDHEWLNIDKERERVQVQLEDGGWVMYQLYRPADLVSDWQKLEVEKSEDEFRAQSWRDAQQWRVITDDTGGDKILFMSEISGEMRAAVEDALSWVIQDDGYGFPSFLHIKTGEITHEDPRFVDDPEAHVYRQRDFILHELRYHVYFCKDYWQQYTGALRINDEKRVQSIMRMIFNSSKPKLLAALVIQAKTLHQPTSLVDKQIDEAIAKELEYASWLTERLAELSQKSAEKMAQAKEAKNKVLKSLVKSEKKKVYCFYCKHETKRNLQYCPTCGKAQVFMN